jgi:transposase
VVAGFADYTEAGLSQALCRLGVKLKRGRLKVHSPDLEYRPKLDLVQMAVQAARGDQASLRVFYGDEFSLYRQPSLGQVYAPCGYEPTAQLSHRSNTRQRYSGALDVVSGRVVWTQAGKMGVDGLRSFLEKLRSVYPDQGLCLIWDNWPVHRHPRVLGKAEALGIQILWLPTYAPWANPIEKLWRWLKQELLHHHRLADQWDDLKASATRFLDRFAAGSPSLLRYVGLLPD